jgi:hypothetical protein
MYEYTVYTYFNRDGWLSWKMGGSVGRWVAKLGDGLAELGDGWLSWEMGDKVWRWVAELGDGWLSWEMGD